MAKKSIYEIIKTNIADDGKMMKGFSLKDYGIHNKSPFVPGGFDGTAMQGHYHPGKPEAEAKTVVELIRQYFQTGEFSIIVEIKELLESAGTLAAVDLILNGIMENHEGIDPQSFIEFALNLAKTSDSIDLVKLGISMLGLFDLGEFKEVIDPVTILAVYDEFTLFSVVAASKWRGGNDIVFKIAHRVDGWGKINAVEWLEPVTDEIRDWILRKGCENNVMDAYLGLTCAKKGDLISALRRDSLDRGLFDSIAIIMDALLDEGPVPGISEYDHAEESLALYLSHAKKYATTLKHLWYILNVKTNMEDSKIANKAEIMALSEEIEKSRNWEDAIRDILTRRDDDYFFYACNIASRMGINVSEQLLAIIKDEPLPYWPYALRFFRKTTMVAEMISIYESVLPLDKLATGMGDDLFAEDLFDEHSCLESIINELKAYPMQGVRFIQTGLNSRVVRERNTACHILAEWIKTERKPLAELSPEIYEEVVRIHALEVNTETKARMKGLIDGVIEE